MEIAGDCHEGGCSGQEEDGLRYASVSVLGSNDPNTNWVSDQVLQCSFSLVLFRLQYS